MHSSLLVVDDFVDNAEGLRQAALRLTYPEQKGAFPGRNRYVDFLAPGPLIRARLVPGWWS